MKSQVTLVVQPNLMAVLTGTAMAKIAVNGKVTLIYTDGTEETAQLSPAELTAGRADWFTLVGSIQAKRGITK